MGPDTRWAPWGLGRRQIMAGMTAAVLIAGLLVAYTISSKDSDNEISATASPSTTEVADDPGAQAADRCFEDVGEPVFNMISAQANGLSTDSVFFPFIAKVGRESVELQIFNAVFAEAAKSLFVLRLEDIQLASNATVLRMCRDAYSPKTPVTAQTTAPSPAPTTTAPPTTTSSTQDPEDTEATENRDGSCVFSDPALPSPSESAQCLYDHWKDGDRDVPEAVAVEDAIDQIFAEEWSDAELISCAKQDSGHRDVNSEVTCTFVGEDITVDMYFGGHPDTGAWTALAVGFYGNPPGWFPID